MFLYDPEKSCVYMILLRSLVDVILIIMCFYVMMKTICLLCYPKNHKFWQLSTIECC